MRFYLGAVCLLIGLWLVYSAISHRRRVLAARTRIERDGGQTPKLDPSLNAMGTAMLPFFVFFGAFASLLLVGGFFLTDLSLHLSLLDLAGLIVLVIGYSLRMTMQTAYSRLGLDLSRS